MAMYYLEHYGFVGEEPYLAHYGVKGMKWRHRRPSIYQHRRDQMNRYTTRAGGSSSSIGPQNSNGNTHHKRESDDDLVRRLNDRAYGNRTNSSNTARLMRLARVNMMRDDYAKKGIYQTYSSNPDGTETMGTMMNRSMAVTKRDRNGGVSSTSSRSHNNNWENFASAVAKNRRRKKTK